DVRGWTDVDTQDGVTVVDCDWSEQKLVASRRAKIKPAGDRKREGAYRYLVATQVADYRGVVEVSTAAQVPEDRPSGDVTVADNRHWDRAHGVGASAARLVHLPPVEHTVREGHGFYLRWF